MSSAFEVQLVVSEMKYTDEQKPMISPLCVSFAR